MDNNSETLPYIPNEVTEPQAKRNSCHTWYAYGFGEAAAQLFQPGCGEEEGQWCPREWEASEKRAGDRGVGSVDAQEAEWW